MSVKRSDLSFNEVLAKYPNFPKLIALKIDMHRRGLYYTSKALSIFDPTRHQQGGTHIFGTRDGKLTARPEALTLRDGTSVLSQPAPIEHNPYIVDLIDGKLMITDQNEAIDEAFFWDKPDYYDKRLPSGAIMQNVASARPQRLYIAPNRYCHFWSDGEGCKFCDIVNNLKQQKEEIAMPARLKPDDVRETVKEALKEKGRFTAICLTAGSDFHGEKPFDKEIDYYIEILQAIGECFETARFPAQLICTAVTKEQIKRLYDNTGVSSLTYDIETLDETEFNRVCPGKARWIGYKEWKKRLIDATEIFGANRVNTGIVSGSELAGDTRFTSEDEALDCALKEADDLASNGVSVVNMVWIPRPKSPFANERNGSLEYYVKLAIGLQEIRRRHKLEIDFDDYRRCGNHPDSDLARAF
ncbi:MAG: hypothetical protein LBI57_07770 [Helicobacteraceae bacterium]|jgi:hypothetical protein|nr:hypothetical protein [Helicobacteraceae bacterium]